MASPTDALRAKTDAELQFFVDNPSFYHADIVTAAQRELMRRGLGSARPASAPSPRPPGPTPTLAAQPAHAAAYTATAYDTDDTDGAAPTAGRRPLLWVAALVLVLAGVWLWQKRTPTAAPVAMSRPPHRSPDSLKLVEVVAHPLPSYDTDPIVATQVAQIPAAEKQQAAALRQFRELCRRFWAAETQTEFLTNQAHAGQAGDLFADQALAVRSTWRDWNKAAVYSYDFGPKMKDQFERMGQVASSQQHILDRMPALLPGRKFLTDKELVEREIDIQDLMRGIRPTSPVTGRPYRAVVLKAHL
ncbi:hypothetical protein E4631_05015 [Hymenobacter sp. UV11]|uniref:hypothetical protein n=1 Tax=Hymenobacter sp. UV11 TaxID=1849735 RepID=UPI00105F8E33|nr:hypothetical protein [Hymenobacter sp. UV11]TDN37272.1 hypothetical protein A8B98_04570 [Hymenobacter sp. UV11]TFZ68352.1 hypothetical protein E4631_05015 [Hymenobacter sp. UV11]